MTFAVFEDATPTDGTARSGTSMLVDYPSTINAGETLLCLLTQDRPDSEASWPAGWDALYSQDDVTDGYAYGAAAVRKATGSESGTFTVTVSDDPCCAVVLRYSGAADPTVSPPAVMVKPSYGASSISHYPPTLGFPEIPRLNDYLWIAVDHENTDQNSTSPSNWPSGYSDTGVVEATDGNGCHMAWAMKTETVQEETPSRFRWFWNKNHVTATIAIFPATDSTTTNDERVTRAAVQALYESTADARVTRAAAQALYEVDVECRVTQLAIQALVPQIPCARKSCQVWKITRIDGEVFRFTTHDEVVGFKGENYSPCDSLQASAAEAAILNAVGGGDIEINGLVSDDSITEFDLANGLFDGATVEVWATSWGDPTLASDSPKRLIKGVLGETTQSPTSYTADIFSTSAKLGQTPLLSTYTPACRFEPGDGKCPVNVSALTVTGQVTAIVDRVARDRRGFRQFYTASIAGGSSSNGSSSSDGEITSLHVYGLLTWTTGSNAGIQSEIKSLSDGLVTLWEPMPNEIQLSDQYSVKPGCAKTADDHQNKFGLSMESFGGFPDLPGIDSITRGPNR